MKARFDCLWHGPAKFRAARRKIWKPSWRGNLFWLSDYCIYTHVLSYNQIEISEGEKRLCHTLLWVLFISMEPTCQPDVSHNNQSISLFPKGFIKSVSAWILFSRHWSTNQQRWQKLKVSLCVFRMLKKKRKKEKIVFPRPTIKPHRHALALCFASDFD